MHLRTLVFAGALTGLLVGCGGGDINISPTNVDESNNNNNQDGDTECASYTVNGTTQEGSFDGTDCTYGTDFVDVGNALTVDLTIPDIGDGVHIFEGTLFVGENHTTDADLDAAGISEGGDGPTLTIEPGVTLAFETADDYAVINRGARIEANGTAQDPITFTSWSDAVAGNVGAEEVSQWGGLLINGFGITNDCSYTGSSEADYALDAECHVEAEGKLGAATTHYGGVNNDDNSGTLNYVIIKHAGFEVAPDNELNGVTFNAIGRGTTVENLQTYATTDDGIEFFGGAVDVTNYVGLYVRDDAIDIDQSYRGTITNALVIHGETTGNHCVESDGLADHPNDDQIDRNLHSQASIRNLTCIVSPSTDVGKGEGAGWRIREGHMPTIQNAIVTTAYLGDQASGDDNYCVRIEHEGLEAADVTHPDHGGELVISQSIVACQDLTAGGVLDPSGTTVEAWLSSGDANAEDNFVMQTQEAGEDPTDTANTDLVILDGFYSVPLADMVVDGNSLSGITPADGASILGAVAADSDWTADWTYGLHDGNRAQPLWFE